MEPKIRFKGFEGQWKAEVFQNSFDPLRNNSLSRAELADDGNIANIHYGDVLIKYTECIDTSVDKLTYILDNEIGKNLVKNGALKRGDIIFADAAEDNTVGKCSELLCKDDELIVSGLHTIACRPRLNVAEKYLGYYLNSPAYHNQLLPHIQGTKISSISKKAINTTSVVFPTQKSEQKAIASYFTSLDSQISASTSRLASLKQMKAASLQAMFPQEGEIVPKIRFQNNRWQKYKVGDLCDLLTGYPFPGDKILTKGKDLLMRGINITEGSIRHSNEIDRYYNEDTIGLEKYRLQVGDLVIGMDGSKVGKNSALVTSKEKNSLLVQRVARLRNEDKNLIKLIQIAVGSDNFIKYVEEMKTSSAIPHISPADIRNFPLSLPEDSNERRLIASYFTSLDHQISLQSQRLEKLKQIKSACLNKMFV